MARNICYLVVGLIFSLCLNRASSWWLGDSKPGSIVCDGVTYNKEPPYDSDSMPLPECFTTYFNLFTRVARDLTISKSNIRSEFDPSKKTKFIVHGFRDSYDDPWITLINTLLAKEDVNVITVDWSEGSHRSVLVGYDNAAANARVAGRALFELFDALISGGLDRTRGHCIGHSLGAHICGYAGQYKKFGRISGMDPAGPELEGLQPGARLSKEDADFVDVLHTNGGGDYMLDYGTLISMGHLDFYANGGKKQPGCLNKRRKRSDFPRDDELDDLEMRLERFLSKRLEDLNTDQDHVEDVKDRLISEVDDLDRNTRGDILGCSHGRALGLYIESINSKKCVADLTYSQTENVEQLTQCTSCPAVSLIVGYHADENRGYSGKFGFTTGSTKPYCG